MGGRGDTSVSLKLIASPRALRPPRSCIQSRLIKQIVMHVAYHTSSIYRCITRCIINARLTSPVYVGPSVHTAPRTDGRYDVCFRKFARRHGYAFRCRRRRERGGRGEEGEREASVIKFCITIPLLFDRGPARVHLHSKFGRARILSSVPALYFSVSRERRQALPTEQPSRVDGRKRETLSSDGGGG